MSKLDRALEQYTAKLRKMAKREMKAFHTINRTSPWKEDCWYKHERAEVLFSVVDELETIREALAGKKKGKRRG